MEQRFSNCSFLVHLAYATAVTHNVQDMVEPLKESLKDDIPIINVIYFFSQYSP